MWPRLNGVEEGLCGREAAREGNAEGRAVERDSPSASRVVSGQTDCGLAAARG